MKKIRNAIGIITIVILIGWVFYASWENIKSIQQNATCNNPVGTQFQEDLFEYVIMSIIRIITIILLAIPGYLYSLCPFPKESSDIILFICFGGGIWLILGLVNNKSLFILSGSTGENETDNNSKDPKNGNSTLKGRAEARNHVVGYPTKSSKGQKFDQDTGRLQNEGFLGGWIDEESRVNKKSGVIQKQGFLGGWFDSNTKVDPGTGIIQEKGFLGGFFDSNTKVNPHTGRIEEKGFFGQWVDTDKRIDPHSGKAQHLGSGGGWVND